MKEKLLGSFCVAKAGHDNANKYIIVGFDANCLLLADGKNKTIEKPKRKNEKHVILLDRYDAVIQNKLQNGGRLTNEEVKRAIKLLDV